MEGISRDLPVAVPASQGSCFSLVSHCYMGRQDNRVLEALRIFYPRQADLIMARLRSGIPVRLGVSGIMDMRLRMSALSAQGFKVALEA